MVVIEKKQRIYFENLDALRFFAFLAVFFSHTFYSFNYVFQNKYLQLIHKHFFINGNLGVNFFFVLSGFLITWLLFTEKENDNTINIKSFYLRRILRIWPVYYFVILLGAGLYNLIDLSFIVNKDFHTQFDLKALPWYLFFIGNFYIEFHEIKWSFLNVLWSVAIEEQFYLFWPIFFFFFNKKNIKYFCFLIIFISFVFRSLNAGILLSTFSTLSVMSELAIGSLLSYYCFYHFNFIEKVKNLKKRTTILVYLFFISFIPIHGFSHIFGDLIYNIYYPFESIIFAVFFSFIIVEQNFNENSFYKFGKLIYISSLGKISYGLYAYHMLIFPIAFLVSDFLQLNDNSFIEYLIRIITSLLLTILFSKISYKYLEKPFLKLKSKI